MSNFEFNKVFAALLCALLTVWLAWFVSYKAIAPKKLEKDAVTIEGASDEHGGGGAAAAPAMPEPILAMLATADAERGAKIAKACAACHSFEKGGPTKQGPNLWAVVNFPKGGHEGFAYSDGLKAMQGKGEWTYSSLNHFLWKPKSYVVGTKMNFIGVKKPQDRADLIAWLRQQADSQVALPTEAEIAEEVAALSPPAAAPAADAPAAEGEVPTDAAVPAEGVAPESAPQQPAAEGAAETPAAPTSDKATDKAP